MIGDRDFGGKVLHSVTQVVFEILFGGDVASNDVVLVAAHGHQGVLRGFLHLHLIVQGDGWDCHPREHRPELSSIDHPTPPLAVNDQLLVIVLVEVESSTNNPQ